MQALYGYYITKTSLQGVVREQLRLRYLPDPALHDLSDTSEMDDQRKHALQSYDDALNGKPVDLKTGVGEEVDRAIDKYHELVMDEGRLALHRMIQEVGDLTNMYNKLFWMLVEFRHIERLDQERQQNARIKKASNWRYHLIDNPFIEALEKHGQLAKKSQEATVSWSGEFQLLKNWYKEVLRNDEALQAYQQLDAPDLVAHRSVLEHIFKKLVFKHESMVDYWMRADGGWTENAVILKSLLIKTIQQMPADADSDWELKKVMLNEEDDMAFFRLIFSETLKRGDELDELIAGRTKNWELSRVALIDRIILKMALAEMMTFPSIPVKVTINEYIEMSKSYSTPKSKQFVNGILDVLANQLTSEGLIRKSGRGLIDNK